MLDKTVRTTKSKTDWPCFLTVYIKEMSSVTNIISYNLSPKFYICIVSLIVTTVNWDTL